MAWIDRKIAKCDVCGHEWLVRDSAATPTHCAKCKSRLWNGSTRDKNGKDKAEQLIKPTGDPKIFYVEYSTKTGRTRTVVGDWGTCFEKAMKLV